MAIRLVRCVEHFANEPTALARPPIDFETAEKETLVIDVNYFFRTGKSNCR